MILFLLGHRWIVVALVGGDSRERSNVADASRSESETILS
eukprot:COSAG05_NODE_12381_length_470_cov_0.886792_1_plen_39_part_10